HSPVRPLGLLGDPGRGQIAAGGLRQPRRRPGRGGYRTEVVRQAGGGRPAAHGRGPGPRREHRGGAGQGGTRLRGGQGRAVSRLRLGLWWGLLLTLAPVALPQALWTRRTALRLPPAEGAQSGLAGAG